MKRALVLLLPVLLTVVGIVLISPSARADSGEFRVRAASDDAEQQSDGTVLNSSDLELLDDKSEHQVVGLRFTQVSIPPGATITRAYVQFTADKSSATTAPMSIYGQATDSAATFSGARGDVSNRPRTTAAAAWSPAAWSAGKRGAAQQTSDLTAVVQEIVSRPRWASGNALAVIIAGTSSNKRVAESFDTSANKAPALYVEWTTGAVHAPTTSPTSGPASQPSPSPSPTPSSSPAPSSPAPSPTAGPAPSSTTAPTTGSTTSQPPRGTSEAQSGTIPVAADDGFPYGLAAYCSVVRDHPPGTVLDERYRISAPSDHTTYDLRGVASTAFPSTSHPFSFGTGGDNLDAGLRTCLVGGELLDQVGYPPAETWDWYHDNANASCVKGAAYEWYQIIDVRCAGIEDGFLAAGARRERQQHALPDRGHLSRQRPGRLPGERLHDRRRCAPTACGRSATRASPSGRRPTAAGTRRRTSSSSSTTC